MSQFGTLLLEEGAEATVKRMNLLQVSCGAAENDIRGLASFKDCPLVWDTGASFRLTPLHGDFVIMWSAHYCAGPSEDGSVSGFFP
jgi:hypothetical protein